MGWLSYGSQEAGNEDMYHKDKSQYLCWVVKNPMLLLTAVMWNSKNQSIWKPFNILKALDGKG